jgi:DNA-binding response OmpR family regulator
MHYQDSTSMDEFRDLPSSPTKVLAPQRSKRILIIDDEFDIRMNLAEDLVNAGYKVATAKNGADGINYLKTQDILPDFIILDMNMPVKDGMEFRFDQLRLPDASDIPTIIMSGDIERRNGMQNEEFLSKPFVFSEVLEAIENVSKRK